MSQRKQSEILYRVKQKQGTHLPPSHDTEGTFRGLSFDDKTNKLVGHPELEPVDESEYEDEFDYSYDNSQDQQEVELSPEMQQLSQALGELIAAATMYALTEYVAPPVKDWWQNKAAPTIKENWKILTDFRKEKPFPKGKEKFNLPINEIVVANEPVQDMFSHKLEEAYEKHMNDMTSEEAQSELLDIFILSALLTAKKRKLSNARIVDNGNALAEYLEGQKILERLTTPEVIGCINQIFESNPQLLERKTADLSEILGPNLVSNGQYVPIEIG